MTHRPQPLQVDKRPNSSLWAPKAQPQAVGDAALRCHAKLGKLGSSSRRPPGLLPGPPAAVTQCLRPRPLPTDHAHFRPTTPSKDHAHSDRPRP